MRKNYLKTIIKQNQSSVTILISALLTKGRASCKKQSYKVRKRFRSLCGVGLNKLNPICDAVNLARGPMFGEVLCFIFVFSAEFPMFCIPICFFFF